MPQLQLVTAGLGTGNGQVTPVGLPSIEGEAIDIIAINAMRGNGLETGVGDSFMVALSHQTDLPATGDEDDFVGVQIDNDLWWVADLTRNASVFDVLPEPVAVAGPQTLLLFNGMGQTTALRLILWYRTGRRLDTVRWSLLKTLTSYEGVT